MNLIFLGVASRQTARIVPNFSSFILSESVSEKSPMDQRALASGPVLTVLTQQVLGAPQNSDSRFLFSISFQGFKFPAVVDVFTSRNFNLSLFILSEYRAELAAQAAGHSDLSEIFAYVGKSGKQLERIANQQSLLDIRIQLR
eukprot:Gregarina_sp_Poly_1__1936@NODE_1506_length_3978_cov_75_398619_g998_i0_p2_GENE_NODE_1506_length_3978_cov_75_398619_g998_i0NODE_1506_length_3978_cov_75_398619_g998_i0_p2_ORF_typecomplete_len143_score15_31_NODE_1506_length_3978_cov_75_398619_g998_i014381866